MAARGLQLRDHTALTAAISLSVYRRELLALARSAPCLRSPISTTFPLNNCALWRAQLIQRVETLDHQVETMGKTVETIGKKINRDQMVIKW